MNIESLNALAPDAARAALLRCCGSRRWVDAMTNRRPFASAAEIFKIADEIEMRLERADWLEAFAAHPRIGDLDSIRKKFLSTADWTSGEQASVAKADEQVIKDLSDGNREYEAKFSHIFIVCATGKTAVEMLAILRGRLGNDPDTELQVAAAEQARITRLRLEK